MKKIALVFALAVLAPSLVLGWLAMRSLRDQSFVFERERSLVYQSLTENIVHDINSYLVNKQREFALKAESLLADRQGNAITDFDEQLRKDWPLAEVGFVVSTGGDIQSPSLFSRPEARQWRLDNDKFFCCESVEVYWSATSTNGQLTKSDVNFSKLTAATNTEVRCVLPQQSVAGVAGATAAGSVSKDNFAPAEFIQLAGTAKNGTVARFLRNKLKLMLWHRAAKDPTLICGAQLDLDRITAELRGLAKVQPTLAGEICVAFLDDTARPIALSAKSFTANWKHPLVSSEIGEALPHWEVAVYLLDPTSLNQTAHAAIITLGLLITVLLLAIGAGSWMIVHCLKKELEVARQKTDFVSNVSHELKTPLTSIRMFSELLAEGRVADPAKQKNYLNIISAEAGRLTRLINNVLDFSHMERGEKKYNLQPCDAAEIIRETADTYRPHLEAHGFDFKTVLPDKPLPVRGDKDAIAQVLVNLISNAEKYSNGTKQITVQVPPVNGHGLEIQILDRGTGVPPAVAQKIFEQFYRANDSLSSGIQGSGLGLTLARQIARAHGGDVSYTPREGGGSCFTLRLPIDHE